ncbi:MAG: serine hydrolase [Candidatus Dojkabacteria bacterium]|nr:serine hydrolase [Candidatus Dojkabacteria bacterium]
MSENCPDKNLEDFRYDAKLFKQAYRAGLKAKEFEKENKRKRTLKILILSFSGVLVILLTIFLINNPIFQKENFLKIIPQEEVLNYSDDDIEPSPISKTDFDSQFVDANAVLYANLNTGEILYEKNVDERLYIASLSKLVSALVALQNFELSEIVTVQEDWYMREDIEWTLELDKGDKVSIETLLQAMLISSYNDAAYILANHMDGGVDAFVDQMNSYVNGLGLSNTVFNNPSGLDNDGGNMSSAKDLYKIATIVYKNDFIMDTITRSYADLSWDIGEDRIYTTNAILGQYGNIAGKTGYTESSGQCFLGITDDGYVTIILGSTDRFADTQKLLLEIE